MSRSIVSLWCFLAWATRRKRWMHWHDLMATVRASTSASSESIPSWTICAASRVSKRCRRRFFRRECLPKLRCLQNEAAQLLRRAEAAQCPAGRGLLRGERVASCAGGDAGLSLLPHRRVGGALDSGRGLPRVSFRDAPFLVLRMDAAWPPARERDRA